MTARDKTASIGLTGGGTAGHVWPHFALFDSPNSALRQAWDDSKLNVVYFGSDSGMERGLVSATMGNRWAYVPLSSGKFRRHFSWRNFTDPFRICVGFVQAFRALRRYRIDVVFSKGGYVAAPVVWAAALLRIPVVIHESDVTPALATKMSLPFCRQMVSAFSETRNYFSPRAAQRIVTMGLPLRSSLFGASREEARAFFFGSSSDRAQSAQGAPDGRAQCPVLLIFGGSLGAEILNRTVQAALARLLVGFDVVHIVGKGKSFAPTDVPEELRPHYRQYEFLQAEMKYAYALADVALSRAGASSLFELAAARIPMLVVPLDTNQSRGDQIINASVFTKAGWAEVLRERDLTPEVLVERLRSYEDENFRKAAVQRLSSAPGPDAAERVAALLAGYLWPKAYGEDESHDSVLSPHPH